MADIKYKECGDCRHFDNGDDCDVCRKHNRPAECYDFPCDDFDDGEQ